MRRTMTSVAAILALAVGAVAVAQQGGPPAPVTPAVTQPATMPVETKEQRDARMKWWREARFGMFIHWGVYSVPGGIYKDTPSKGAGEWIMHDMKIPVADYAKLPAQFNPTKFNADDFVALAKKAGMKYMVITAKHHDGFAIFETKVGGGWNIIDATPFKRDPLKELAAACKKADMKLGFYYSQAQDWHQPGGAAIGGHWDKAQDGSFDDYLRSVAVPHVQELLSNYGPVAVLWWDTAANMNAERAALFAPVLKLQPNIITNNRLGGGVKGDTETPEQKIPATGYKDRDWETCMTMNGTWGYKSTDTNWKSTATLMKNLIDISSKGGNYLLNVGPTPEGLIPQASVDRLSEMGAWLAKNGEAIYGTTASPFRHYSFDGRATVKGNVLYLHVFNWPAEGIRVEGLLNQANSAVFLADGAKAELVQDDHEKNILGVTPQNFTIKPPAKADAIATVVAITLDGEPKVAEVATSSLGEDGTAHLRAKEARIVGNTAKYEPGDDQDDIGFWTDKSDTVEWVMRVPEAKAFEVLVTYACDAGAGGSGITVSAGEKSVAATVHETGSWSTFQTESLGRLDLPAGNVVVTVKAKTMPHGAVMNLREVRLVPVN